MGKRRRQKTNNSIEDLMGNEENEYPVTDPKRMMINMSNEFNDVYKDLLKGEIKNELFEIFMEKLQEKVKANIQNQLKEYQDNTNEKLQMQKQLNELRETSTNFKMK
jgi:hypothetical protein